MNTKREKLEHLFAEIDRQGGVNGVFMAAERGEVIYEAAFGFAERSSGRRLTTNTVFELASLSKPFTALGVIVLEEQGKLAYDDPVSLWIPELPYPGITVRQLLGHTSGLPDYMELFFTHWDRTRIAANEDVLDMLLRHQPPVYFEPGESWLYSNTGYVLLAILIKRISGLTFAEFMRSRIFHPLGMTRTSVYNRRCRPETISDYAYGYVFDFHSGEYMLPDDIGDTQYVTFLDGIQGDGTVNSNLSDLLKFDRALYTDSLVSRRSLAQVFAPIPLNNGDTFDYGFGWILEQKEGKGRAVLHSGGWPGYASVMIRYIDADMTLIYLRNREQDVEFDQAVISAAEHILLELPYDIPRLPPEQKIASFDRERYERYVGTYRLGEEGNDGDSTIARVLIEEDRLFMQITGKVRLELYPSTQTRFFVRLIPVEVEFLCDGEGKAEKLIVIQEDAETPGVRIGEG
ncbi:serine hydrolase [Paenibacillus sp. GYB004]|uniref:serine hydrolase n=1 Tax=Paenibacillus sp. GYB004 TaxID=2994393 RepID=UPI002F962195